MNDTKAIAKIDRANVLVMLTLGLVSAITLSWNITIGLFVGCAVMVFDFYALRKLLELLLSGKTKSMVISAGLLAFKFVGLFAVVAACLFYIPMNLFAFGLGATAVVVTAAIVAASLQQEKKES